MLRSPGTSLRFVVLTAQHAAHTNPVTFLQFTTSLSCDNHHEIPTAVQTHITLYPQLFPATHDIWIFFSQKLGPIQAFSGLGILAPFGLCWYEQLKYGFKCSTIGLLESQIFQPSTFGVIRMDIWRDGRVRVCFIKVMEDDGRSRKFLEYYVRPNKVMEGRGRA